VTITDAVPLTSGAATTPVVFAVYGTPAGQGRISFRGKGRGAYHSNDAKLKPWRKAIINAAQAATGRHTYIDWQKTCAKCQVPEAEHALFVGVPMAVSVTITVEKPKSAPKRRRSWPITRYSTDIDHHARACLDALSQSGLLHDDSMVVELTARKVYPHEHLSALDQPGALIRIWRINDDHTT
jgi:Holliday junction resolvase RusA-like endonuclease